MKRFILLLALLTLAAAGYGQTPAASAVTTNDIKNVETPSTADRLKGDPGGVLTGTVGDVAVSDAKKGLTIGDALNQIGQNKIAINLGTPTGKCAGSFFYIVLSIISTPHRE